MVRVRDLTKKKTEYKGHEIEAGAGGKNCPCLPCWNVHDCGTFHNGVWLERWECAERFNRGCPEVLKRPRHLFKFTKRFDKRKKGDVFKCLRCGQKLIIGQGDFDWSTLETRFMVIIP